MPCPPELTTLLHAHLAEHGTTPDGRLFRRARGGPLAESVYGPDWDRARAAALSPEEYASPLARRPYDLRHAAVSTWLNSGVLAPQVAQWAGHSVDVLLRVYAKCIAGQEDAVRRRVEEALHADGTKIGPCMVREHLEPAAYGRTQPASTKSAPDRVSAGQGPFGVVVAGRGFEPL